MWAKSDCNCKSARQKLKDQQTDKNGGRQVLLQLLLLLLLLQFVVVVVTVVVLLVGQVSVLLQLSVFATVAESSGANKT